jgi:large subunit ribosomal protein L18
MLVMGIRSRADIRRSIHGRIRKKISGTSERPRLAVYRSTKHIYAQIIDDVSGTTLVSASSVEKDLKTGGGANIKAAELIGKAIAERAIKAGINEVVFDRGGFIYHGRVKALLDATRVAGLNKTSEGDAKAKAPAEEETATEEKPVTKAKAKPKAKKVDKTEESAEKAEKPKGKKKPKSEAPADEAPEAKADEEKEESKDQKSAEVESAENIDE